VRSGSRSPTLELLVLGARGFCGAARAFLGTISGDLLREANAMSSSFHPLLLASELIERRTGNLLTKYRNDLRKRVFALRLLPVVIHRLRQKARFFRRDWCA
jgi:hypothetical protein